MVLIDLKKHRKFRKDFYDSLIAYSRDDEQENLLNQSNKNYVNRANLMNKHKLSVWAITE